MNHKHGIFKPQFWIGMMSKPVKKVLATCHDSTMTQVCFLEPTTKQKEKTQKMLCNLHAHAHAITATTYATHMHKENKVFKYIGLLNIAINILMRRNGMGI